MWVVFDDESAGTAKLKIGGKHRNLNKMKRIAIDRVREDLNGAGIRGLWGGWRAGVEGDWDCNARNATQLTHFTDTFY